MELPPTWDSRSMGNSPSHGGYGAFMGNHRTKSDLHEEVSSYRRYPMYPAEIIELMSRGPGVDTVFGVGPTMTTISRTPLSLVHQAWAFRKSPDQRERESECVCQDL
jgi:hypothetical protein